jgi:large subunit ribosomal protein L23
MHKYDVLRRPVITEKTDVMAEAHNQYVFEVARRANKVQICQAVQELFGVTVLDVRTALMPGKPRRWGRHVSHTPSWKKAIVTLQPGDRIETFE